MHKQIHDRILNSISLDEIQNEVETKKILLLDWFIPHFWYMLCNDRKKIECYFSLQVARRMRFPEVRNPMRSASLSKFWELRHRNPRCTTLSRKKVYRKMVTRYAELFILHSGWLEVWATPLSTLKSCIQLFHFKVNDPHHTPPKGIRKTFEVGIIILFHQVNDEWGKDKT